MAPESVYVLVNGKPYRGQVAPETGFADGLEAVRLLENTGDDQDITAVVDAAYYPIGTLLLARWDGRSRHEATGQRVLRLVDPPRLP
jgi:hypothetical protein